MKEIEAQFCAVKPGKKLMRYHFLRKIFVSALLALLFVSLPFLTVSANETGSDSLGDELSLEDEYANEVVAEGAISDPLAPMNRFFFHFNDKVYFWVLKPAAKAYGAVLPESFRGCVRNFFNNLQAPIRIVNNLLQGKIQASGTELTRLVINSTVGVYGLADPAKNEFGLAPKDEDLGQTLGTYGFGGGVFLCWPFLGPSNVRDTFGFVGDSFLDPLSYLADHNTYSGSGAYAGREVNSTSLRIGDYEAFKDASIDPYTALRDGYQQHRNSKIKDEENPEDEDVFSSRQPVGGEEQMSGPSLPFAAATSMTDRNFFVHVGAFVDSHEARDTVEKLRNVNKKPVVTVYNRGDYSFYGIQVPAGKSFACAKNTENELSAAGFAETMVVAR